MRVRPFVLGALLFTAACNVNQAKLAEPTAELTDSHSEDAVAGAVRAGLAAKGWKTLSEGPGAIEAEVTSGGHFARVRITYSSSGWTIGYLDASPGLKYHEHPKHGPIIHHRYNLWITNLDAEIRAALNAGATVPAGSATGADTDGAEAPATTGAEDESADTHADEWD